MQPRHFPGHTHVSNFQGRDKGIRPSQCMAHCLSVPKKEQFPFPWVKLTWPPGACHALAAHCCKEELQAGLFGLTVPDACGQHKGAWAESQLRLLLLRLSAAADSSHWVHTPPRGNLRLIRQGRRSVLLPTSVPLWEGVLEELRAWAGVSPAAFTPALTSAGTEASKPMHRQGPKESGIC